MKKLLFAIGLLTCIAASGQNFHPQSFIPSGISSLYVSNTFGITNLNLFSIVSTNKAGTIWTNGSLNAVTVVAGSNDTVNLLGDVSVWPDREGRWYPETIVVTNTLPKTDVPYGNTPFNVSWVVNGGANFTNSLNVVLVPIYDGTYEATDETFAFNIVGNGTTYVSGKTNLPIWRWPGAKGIRAKSITQTNGQAVANNVAIQRLNLNCFQP